LPGETISFSGGRLLVNGEPQEEPYLKLHSNWNERGRRLGSNEYFFVGDNRSMPPEQHEHGVAYRSQIVGRVLFKGKRNYSGSDSAPHPEAQRATPGRLGEASLPWLARYRRRPSATPGRLGEASLPWLARYRRRPSATPGRLGEASLPEKLREDSRTREKMKL
jgi:hypothetical protein